MYSVKKFLFIGQLNLINTLSFDCCIYLLDFSLIVVFVILFHTLIIHPLLLKRSLSFVTAFIGR